MKSFYFAPGAIEQHKVKRVGTLGLYVLMACILLAVAAIVGALAGYLEWVWITGAFR